MQDTFKKSTHTVFNLITFHLEKCAYGCIRITLKSVKNSLGMILLECLRTSEVIQLRNHGHCFIYMTGDVCTCEGRKVWGDVCYFI